jgi:hypothetical protein
MATQDQVAWASVNVSTAGEQQNYARGALLPEVASAEESAERSLLRLGGAIRTVEVVYTPEELAAAAQLRGEEHAARVSAHDVDPSLPGGQQVPGTAKAGPPTLVTGTGSPVVIGPEPDAKPVPKTAASSSTSSGSGSGSGSGSAAKGKS